MITNENTEFAGDAHGLGFELDQRWYMGGLSSLRTAGHTGYTGTSLVIDFASRSFVILLTNRVHPSRSGAATTRPGARSRGISPRRSRSDRSMGGRRGSPGSANARTVTLTAPATPGGELMFGLWYDTEAGYDVLTLETSTDGGSTWTPEPFDIRSGPTTDGTISGFGGRRWHHASAMLPEGDDVLVRWRYASDAANQGRGVYVDRVRVDGKRIPDHRYSADGWTRSPN